MINLRNILLSSTLVVSSYATNIDKNSYEIGKKIYEETCISCHGIDGKASNDIALVVKPRDLTQTLLDEEQTYYITKDGAHYWGAKADIMPSFKSVYNEKQLRAVAHFISIKFNPNVKERITDICKECEEVPKEKESKMLKRGKKIYNRNCKFCHGDTAKGDGIATKSPVDSIFPYDLTKTLLTKQQMFLYVKYGGKHWGTDKNDMPGWKKKYDDFTLRSVTKYVDEVLRKKD
ncbi:MAG: c-type cytochrome [Campylobacterota bacterium]|nr:c-type cytochrome [Campylobacterota bacterium]